MLWGTPRRYNLLPCPGRVPPAIFPGFRPVGRRLTATLSAEKKDGGRPLHDAMPEDFINQNGGRMGYHGDIYTPPGENLLKLRVGH